MSRITIEDTKAGMKAVGIGTAQGLPEADAVLSDTKELTLEFLQKVIES